MRPQSIGSSFRAAQPALQRYIAELESENAKLHRHLAKLEVQNVSKQNRIAALEKALQEESKKHKFTLNTYFSGERPHPKKHES